MSASGFLSHTTHEVLFKEGKNYCCSQGEEEMTLE